MPRRPFPVFLALVSALAIAFGVPIVRDGPSGGAPSAAVLSARSDSAPSASPSSAVGPGSPGPDQRPLSGDPGGDSGRPHGGALAGMLATEHLWGERWATPPALLTGYRWPLARGRITQPFGPSPAGTLLVDGLWFHDGLDIATFCGDHVVAAHAGLVIAAGRRVDPWMGGVGSLAPSIRHRDAGDLWNTLPIIVVIDDGNGYRSVYAHFNQVVVHVGDRVRAGQFIGYEGATGFATGCHVHYGLFNPLETATMELRPDVARRTKLPAYEIARINPLLVLPARPLISAVPGGAPTVP